MKPKSYLTSFLALLLPMLLLAMEPKAGNQITINEPVEADLYLAGSEVDLNAKISGDVVVACSELKVRDTITQDLIAAMGDMTLSGYVGDDVRIFTGTVDINNSVGGDLIVFGGEVEFRKGYTVEGDLVVFGGSVAIAGTVAGKVRIYGGEVAFDGQALGDMEVYTDQFELNGTVAGKAKLVADKIDLGKDARIEGPVRYWTAAGEMDFGATASNTTYDPTLADERDTNWGGYSGWGFFLLSFLSSALLALLLIFLFGRYFERSAQHIQTAWIRSFAYGVLYVIGVPVAIIVLLVSVIGIPIGLLSLAIYIFTIVFAPTIASVVYAYCTDQYYDKGWSNSMLFLVAMALYVVLWLIMLIPFVGWLAGVVAIGIGIGALLMRQKDTGEPALNP